MRKGKRLNVLISAGATREPIDPVRFISNFATGYFGFEIAKEAKKRGHRVRVVAGAISCDAPKGIKVESALTARQMQKKLNASFPWCDCLIMNAAVSDYRAKQIANQKIKRLGSKTMAIKFRTNPDILKGLGKRKQGKILVGFALETKEVLKNARKKLSDKNLDIIVATSMKKKSYPFGRSIINSKIITKGGKTLILCGTTKVKLSRILLDNIERTVLE